jgi:hypothetical protein
MLLLSFISDDGAGYDDDDDIQDEDVSLQEKQLKKIRAKQRRLQAILGGEDTLKIEAELLLEDDVDEGELLLTRGILVALSHSLHICCTLWSLNYFKNVKC